MIQKNKIIITTIFFSTLLFVVVFFLLFKTSLETKNKALPEPELSKQEEKVRIAVCPTYHEIVKKLDSNNYQIILTNSTAESINFLTKNQTDLILSGRTLKPEEPNMEKAVIGEGYSFLNKNGSTVYINQLKNYNIYTDLESKILEKAFLLEEVQKVDDVYEYLDQGIIITSWENTDYSQAEIVHVLNLDGSRTYLSRRLTLYCARNCNQEKIEAIVSVLKN